MGLVEGTPLVRCTSSNRDKACEQRSSTTSFLRVLYCTMNQSRNLFTHGGAERASGRVRRRPTCGTPQELVLTHVGSPSRTAGGMATALALPKSPKSCCPRTPHGSGRTMDTATEDYAVLPESATSRISPSPCKISVHPNPTPRPSRPNTPPASSGRLASRFARMTLSRAASRRYLGRNATGAHELAYASDGYKGVFSKSRGG